MKKQEHQLAENWQHIKETLKARHPSLTEDDLHFEKGGEEALVERLKDRLSMTRDEVMDLLREGQLGAQAGEKK